MNSTASGAETFKLYSYRNNLHRLALLTCLSLLVAIISLSQFVVTSNSSTDNHMDAHITASDLVFQHAHDTMNCDIEGTATLTDGVQLPFSIVNNCQPERETDPQTRIPSQAVGFIFGHGLGARSPRTKNHKNDEWNEFMMHLLINQPQLQQLRTVFYTARGHGASDGWQHDAANNGEQFQWNNLGKDMHEVATLTKTSSGYSTGNQYITGGSSMGSASALYCAIHFPAYVKGVVMIRPPTAWTDREARRSHLLKSSERLRKEEESMSHWLVLKHAAYSDLPNVFTATGRAELSRINCPVLILTIDGDHAHPVSTARELAAAIPHAVFHLAADKTEAKRMWPQLIANFIEEIGR